MVIMVDVELEHSLRQLVPAVRAFSRNCRDQSTQHRLCRALRDVKLDLNDVVRWYGGAYHVACLRALVDRVAENIPPRLTSRYLPAIRRHIAEIRKMLRRSNRLAKAQTARI